MRWRRACWLAPLASAARGGAGEGSALLGGLLDALPAEADAAARHDAARAPDAQVFPADARELAAYQAYNAGVELERAGLRSQADDEYTRALAL